jgi:glycosyltransferase involved in cell wall biosynthesis
MTRHDLRVISTYDIQCGIAKFSENFNKSFNDFTGEIGARRVASIDSEKTNHSTPVDLIIEKYNPISWRRNTSLMKSKGYETGVPTVFSLQHEFGLDPGDNGEPALGDNYVKIAKSIQEENYNNFTVITTLHTITKNPTKHQLSVLQDLGLHSDMMVVQTKTGMILMKSKPYNIEPSKLRRIDHGIRTQDPSSIDRQMLKKEYGLEKILLLTTLGLKSPNKGIHTALEGYGEFINNNLTKSQKRDMVYLIAGKYHDNFIKEENGNLYRAYNNKINGILESQKIKNKTIKHLSQLRDINPQTNNVIFLDKFLDEDEFNKVNAMSNGSLMPYTNLEQISSGILADTVGSGRVAITTKYPHAIDLLEPSKFKEKGIILDEQAKGLLIDPENPEHVCKAIDYLVFEEKTRLLMEKRAFLSGQMRSWHNTAAQFVSMINSIEKQKVKQTGRGTKFQRIL